MNTDKGFENWKRIEPVIIVDPDIIVVTINVEYYDIKPMLTPFELKS